MKNDRIDILEEKSIHFLKLVPVGKKVEDKLKAADKEEIK